MKVKRFISIVICSIMMFSVFAETGITVFASEAEAAVPAEILSDELGSDEPEAASEQKSELPASEPDITNSEGLPPKQDPGLLTPVKLGATETDLNADDVRQEGLFTYRLITTQNDETYARITKVDPSIEGTLIIPLSFENGLYKVRDISAEAFVGCSKLNAVDFANLYLLKSQMYYNSSANGKLNGISFISTMYVEDKYAVEAARNLSYSASQLESVVRSYINNEYLDITYEQGVAEITEYVNGLTDDEVKEIAQAYLYSDTATRDELLTYFKGSDKYSYGYRYGLAKALVAAGKVTEEFIRDAEAKKVAKELEYVSDIDSLLNNVSIGQMLSETINYFGFPIKTFKLSSSNLFFKIGNGSIYLDPECDLLKDKDWVKKALIYCTLSKNSYTSPDDLVYIGSYAFRYNKALEKVTLKNSVKYINSYAFYDCTSLQTVTLPKELESFNAYSTFYNCEALEKVTMPETVNSGGSTSSTFENCRKLTSIEIPEGFTRIGYDTFWNCEALTSITLPSTLTDISTNAFYNVRKITSIVSKAICFDQMEDADMFRYMSELTFTAHNVNGISQRITDGGGTFNALPKHKLVATPELPATCTEDGYTSGIDCDVCGHLTDPEPVRAHHTDEDNDDICDVCGEPTATVLTLGETATGRGNFDPYNNYNNNYAYVLFCFTPEETGDYTVTLEEYGNYGFASEIDDSYISSWHYSKTKEYYDYTDDNGQVTLIEGTKYYFRIYEYVYNDFEDVFEGATDPYLEVKATLTYCPHSNTEKTEATWTCTKTGFTEGEVCKDCGKQLYGNQSHAAEHVDADGDDKCDVCGKAYYVTIKDGASTSLTVYDKQNILFKYKPKKDGVYKITLNGENFSYGTGKVYYDDEYWYGSCWYRKGSEVEIYISNDYADLQGGTEYVICLHTSVSAESGKTKVTAAIESCDHTETRMVTETWTCERSGETEGEQCKTCGRWLSGHENHPGWHTDEDIDGVCDVCGKTASVLDSGICNGTDESDATATWQLDTLGVLKIIGTGEVTQFPWADYDRNLLITRPDGTTYSEKIYDNVHTVYIDSGITKLNHSYYDSDIFNSYSAFYNSSYYIKYFAVDPDNETFSSEDGVLFNKDKTTLLRYPAKKTGTDYTVPSTVKTVFSYAFEYTDMLRSVTLSDACESIGYEAFYDSGLNTEFIIPASVATIESYAFNYCQITAFKVAAANENYSSDKYGALYNKDKTFLIKYPEGNTNAYYKFPDTITGMDYNSVYRSKFSELGIPACELEFDGRYFYNCYYLAKVTVDAANTKYFSDASGVVYSKDGTTLVLCPRNTVFTEYTVASGVTTIGPYAFYYCSKLTDIKLPSGLTTIGECAFESCSSITKMKIPAGVTEIPYDAFEDCYNLSEIELPESLTVIGGYAFGWCYNLKEIKLPSTLVTIGYGAFYDCSDLTEIFIPASVESISSEAFRDCSNLVKITVDEENGYYSNDADGVLFNKDKTTLLLYPLGKKDTEYTVPDGVTTIGSYAFGNSSRLGKITFPESTVTFNSYSVYYSYERYSVTLVINNNQANVNIYVYYKNVSIITNCAADDVENKVAKYAYDYDLPLELRHDYEDVVTEPTATSDGYTTRTCKRCGKVVTENIQHVWDEGTVTREATCQEEGVMTYNCKLCDAQTNASIPKTDHTPESLTDEDATCTKPGKKGGTYCSVCNTVIERPAVTSALGHDYEGAVTVATCTEGGYTVFTCTRCGDTYTDDETAATGHQYGAPVYVWTDDYASCTATAVCAFDASHIVTETVATTSVSVPSECTSAGSATYTADFDNELFADQTKTIASGLADHTPGEAEKENIVAPTCVTEGSYEEVIKCSVCGAEISRTTITTDKEAHTPGEAVRENDFAPTCSKSGSYDEVVYCTVCSQEISRTAYIVAMTDHTPAEAVRENVVPPTCVSTGSYDDVVYCSVCGTEISRKSVQATEKGEHKWGKGVITKSPTTKQEGLMEYTCEVCKEKRTETLSKVKTGSSEATSIVDNNKVLYDTDTKVDTNACVYYDENSGLDETIEFVANKESETKETVRYQLDLFKNGEKIEPEGDVWVKLHMPENWTADKVGVRYIDDDGKVEWITDYFCDGRYIYFKTSHFSTYEIVRDVQSEVASNAEIAVTIVKGDINGDGTILADDARLALRASAKLETFNAVKTIAADVDENSEIYADDARQILRYSAKLQTEFKKSTK